ncbi:hypothetical protein [uncultured Cohaesibacter sp.]|uniref:hypothetical protein n=1 Tax=uncultured Cohaesibacter sp. TaxID=1002546 RepID=UPI00292FD0F6|nr:hypothetical protein [uncultured Cohaesibacter sp.]
MSGLIKGIARASLIAGILALSPGSGAAQGAKSPYDTVYKVIADSYLRKDIAEASGKKAQLEKGTTGVVMRWCRPEFSFRDWAYGTLSKRRKMLQVRACEVKANGVVGFVDAKILDPM